MKKQAGFTLIELAIVLVIIGLLLGGVLKGQALIDSAKVKNMAADFKNVQVYIYGYQDKYRALPGDDSKAVEHVGATKNGNLNGKIDDIWSSVDTDDESLNFWQHVRKAGLAAGDQTVASSGSYIPVNADNGRLGIQSGQTPSITGLKGVHVLCSDRVLGKFSKQLDVNIDDGDPTKGSIMIVAYTTGGTSSPVTGTANVDPTTLASIGDNDFTTVCMAF
ncbi:MAG: prepilin-type N-terminal cleavage/methylation domain-containing protein [Methylotenera sp.]|uniref:prepilin-type N-terminal cleavage/methylation domain-containing protein n=1 Tax=Methylotenera sp. TaxID=2051956 RepID=UPI0017C92F19|nr:prepilin-type N-terminal cleavage/methylation domain-containing protein [Methylotenera sp.]NOU25863.1 prepilin-type N-terminal cleavage/methylation domain-containing protein [Methylotenera sp.]